MPCSSPSRRELLSVQAAHRKLNPEHHARCRQGFRYDLAPVSDDDLSCDGQTDMTRRQYPRNWDDVMNANASAAKQGCIVCRRWVQIRRRRGSLLHADFHKD